VAPVTSCQRRLASAKQAANMLGDLPYVTPLQVVDPANGRSVILLYKRDIGAGQPLSHTLRRYPYRIDLTRPAETQLGLSGSRSCRSPGSPARLRRLAPSRRAAPITAGTTPIRSRTTPTSSSTPGPGQLVYVAEDVTPVAGLYPRARGCGQPVVTFAFPQNDGIETGWAQPDAANPPRDHRRARAATS
jgi:hypothetical protein